MKGVVVWAVLKHRWIAYDNFSCVSVLFEDSVTEKEIQFNFFPVQKLGSVVMSQGGRVTCNFIFSTLDLAYVMTILCFHGWLDFFFCPIYCDGKRCDYHTKTPNTQSIPRLLCTKARTNTLAKKIKTR